MTQIAFTNGAALFRMNANGTGTTAVVGDANNDPDWSPAGTLLSYDDRAADNCNFSRLDVVQPSGAGHQDLTNDTSCNYIVEGNSFAPNAQRIAYWSNALFCPPTCADGGLFTIKPDEGNP